MWRMQAYENWIKAWTEKNFVWGSCYTATHEMIKEFPELIIKKGFVYCESGERQHWWLETKDGKVVDPTASQFKVIMSYKEYKDGMEVRVGKCMDCGEGIYATSEVEAEEKARQQFCNSFCADNFAESLKGY